MSAQVRTIEDVAEHVRTALRFGPPGTIGAELEWFVHRADGSRPELDRVDALLGGARLPGRSLLTREPGGQVELSSPPLPGPQPAVDALAADLLVVRQVLGADGITLAGAGTDPDRPPVRQLTSPRYARMAAFFEADGGPSGAAGRSMMCSSAAVQVSVDAGVEGTGVQSVDERWRRAHAVGPALVAAFACSPRIEGRDTGWASTRQLLWSRIDPSRTAAPDPRLGVVEAVAAQAWSARLLGVRGPDGALHHAPRSTFGEWARQAALTAPTVSDLSYHLTTLFPPVRARGWLEVRYLDGLPDPLWQVAVGVVAALLDDDVAADQARAACAPVEGRWLDAARRATGDPELARAASACLSAAVPALVRLGAGRLATVTENYLERYTDRGRCPADDQLAAGWERCA